MISEGQATVWICKDRVYITPGDMTQGKGCGYIGLYKPEYDEDSSRQRACPACGNHWTYSRTSDIARITVEGPS